MTTAAAAPTPGTPGDPARQLWRAVLLMTLSAVFFGFMAITIRKASEQLHAFEVAFFRNLFGLLFALPILFRHGPGILGTDKLPLYLFRCVIGTISMLSGFWAIAHLPIAQAIAITYSTPLFVTIGAVLVLGEVVRARRWTAVFVGFLGVLVVVRPFSQDFSAGIFVALLAAAMSASVSISIKFLTRTESADAIVLTTTMLWVPMTLIPALLVWQWPVGLTWLWVALAGGLGTTAHMLWTRGLRLGDASVLTPISFVQLPVVAVLAWCLFDEHLDRYTAIGSAIIFASNIYIARREAKLAQRVATDPEIAGDRPPPR